MAKQSEIKSFFEKTIRDAVNIPRISEENRSFTEDGQPYLDPNIIFSDGLNRSLEGEYLTYDGFYTILIHSIKNKGGYATAQIIEELNKVFEVNERYPYGDTEIQITGFDEKPPLPNNSFYTVPLQIKWIAS